MISRKIKIDRQTPIEQNAEYLRDVTIIPLRDSIFFYKYVEINNIIITIQQRCDYIEVTCKMH